MSEILVEKSHEGPLQGTWAREYQAKKMDVAISYQRKERRWKYGPFSKWPIIKQQCLLFQKLSPGFRLSGEVRPAVGGHVEAKTKNVLPNKDPLRRWGANQGAAAIQYCHILREPAIAQAGTSLLRCPTKPPRSILRLLYTNPFFPFSPVIVFYP